jgi:multiple sugar transport system permease protein
MTMPVVLANDGLNSTGNASYIPIMLAGTVLSFLPILAIFLIFQRQFIESVSQSGIKG